MRADRRTDKWTAARRLFLVSQQKNAYLLRASSGPKRVGEEYQLHFVEWPAACGSGLWEKKIGHSRLSRISTLSISPSRAKQREEGQGTTINGPETEKRELRVRAIQNNCVHSVRAAGEGMGQWESDPFSLQEQREWCACSCSLNGALKSEHTRNPTLSRPVLSCFFTDTCVFVCLSCSLQRRMIDAR